MGADGRTHYEVLGVPTDATLDEIRRAYHAHARRLHPDAGTVAADGRAMQSINEAWRVLRDGGARREYDRTAGIAPTRHDRPAPWEAGDRVAGERSPAADLPEDAPRAGRFSDLLLLVPAGLLVAAVALFGLGMMLLEPALVGAAFGLLLLSGVAFLLAPFLSLARERPRRWRFR